MNERTQELMNERMNEATQVFLAGANGLSIQYSPIYIAIHY